MMTEVTEITEADVERSFYASKPLACSSPLIVMKDGSPHRYHPGYFSGYFRIEHPSYYSTDIEKIRAQHTFVSEKKTKPIWESI